jgi:putative transposase
MDVADARRLRELEGENGKLKKLLAEAMRAKRGISERRACGLMWISRTVLRYRAAGDLDQSRLPEAIKSLAAQRRRFGYCRIHVLIHREGRAVNRKRVQRIYCEEGLQVAQTPAGHGGGAAGARGAIGAERGVVDGLCQRQSRTRSSAQVPDDRR